MQLNEIITILENWAPPKLAAKWDNVGLMIGDRNWDVKKILLTLDVTENAINQALDENVDLILSHHPFIFRPIKNVTNPNYIKLIQNNIAVYSMHTNLDFVKDGVNKALADKLGLKNLRFIDNDIGVEVYHISVLVPKDYVDKVMDSVFEAGSGVIGDYSNCMNSYEVKGQFKPLEGANPLIGNHNELEYVDEVKVEFSADSLVLNRVLGNMLNTHPYETPAYQVYPQKKLNQNYGLGYFGELESEVSLEQFAFNVKNLLHCPYVKLWTANKNKSDMIKKVAVCGGSGSSLLSKVQGKADVFVSADFNYHTIIDSKVPIIDAGHFHTENAILEEIKKRLSDFELEFCFFENHEISKLVTI